MHTKFERLLSKSLTTLEVMSYYLVVHTGPGVGIMEADDHQVTTVFTIQPSFHYRHSTNQVSWSVTIVGERAVTPHLVVRRRCWRFMILGLSGADGGMTVGLWKLSSLDDRRPSWYRPLVIQSHHWSYNTRHVAGQPPQSQFVTHEAIEAARAFQATPLPPMLKCMFEYLSRRELSAFRLACFLKVVVVVGS